MFNFFSRKEDTREKKPAGPAFIVLNLLRTCNIISLLLVAVASWIMLVMTVKKSDFFFFDGFSHFITSTVAIFLILSELSLFKPYFTRNWPVLGPNSSFLFVGSTMVALGFNVLGNLNKEATSVAVLGLPMWRVVISSGILCSVFGFAAFFANFWYRDTANNLTARHARSRYVVRQESLPTNTYLRPLSLNGDEPMTTRQKFMSRLPFTSNKRESRRFPVISGPYRPDRPDPYDIEKLSRSNSGSTLGKNYGHQPEVLEDRMSPIVDGMQRPPTALHPFHRNQHSNTENRYSASQYSVATHGPF